MESWEDQGVILSVRPHGESGGVLSLLTEQHGRHAGYLHGAHSSKYRGVMEPGTLVSVSWQARISDSLGTCRVEQERSYASFATDDRLRLSALLSACALCDAALPEREGHPGLFHGMLALLETLGSDVWGPAYVMWEIALLRELGFSLDFSRCAGGGDATALAWVSPRTGRAVSYTAGEPYKDKLLPLPSFLKPNGAVGEMDDVLAGLQMTGYFLEHRAFAHHSRGVPEARRLLQDRVARHVADS
ncbi:MAG: DNA repair protein RecO [Alphaproteobacteria bacterium]|nr:DNA repair protein RecO [Alphaproteobacteria bacterium]